MKHIYKTLLLLLLSILTFGVQAQHSRRELRSGVPYRANYMRASTGAVASHSLEIKEGNIWAWGLNNNGQLGDGTLINKTNAIQIGNDNTWVLVAVGNYHSFGIKANGTLWAWGLNNDGQLGDGSFINKNIPFQIGADSNWISIKAGTNFSIGLKANGTLWAWGKNDWGQLGIGTTMAKSNIPIQINTEQNWTSIMCGNNHAIALKSNGTLWAWGKNDFGQLGDSGLVNKNEPILISLDSNWTKISAGANHNLALRANGTLWAWGNNLNGELGDNTFIQKNHPVQIGNEHNWIAISAGTNHSMGIKVYGTLYTWGENNNGQLGNENTVSSNIPAKVGIANNWVYISAGNSFSMALGANGKLFTFGKNSFGELGNNSLINQHSPILKSLPANEWLVVYASRYYSLGIKTNGTLWAWGYNLYSTLGNGVHWTQGQISYNIPIQIGSDSNWTSIGLGIGSVLALKSNGTIWVWGLNSLVSGLTQPTLEKSPIRHGMDSNWSEISLYNRYIAIKADGTLWMHGISDTLFANQSNELIMYGTNSDWVGISNGPELILKSNGTIWSFRTNGIGYSSDGRPEGDRPYLLRVGNDNDWTQIHGGFGFNTAIKSNGTLWVWGKNVNGELGDGTFIDRDIPTQIGLQNDWLLSKCNAVQFIYYLEGFHRFGIKTNGTLWAWGQNDFGQLGNNTLTSSLTPVKIGTNNNWIAISAGSDHSIGLKSDRTSFCASGNNEHGQLGDSTTINKAEFICNVMPPPCIPPRPPSLTNSTICYNTKTILNTTGDGIISWYSDSLGGNYLASGNSFNTPLLNNITTYYAQDSTCGASKRTKVTVSVLPKSKIGFTLNNGSKCINNTLIYTDTSVVGQGKINRLWKLNNLDTSTSINFTKNFDNAGSYTIQLIITDDLNYCKDSLSKTFNIYPKPQITISANSTIICQGETIKLTGNGAKTYNWNNNILNNEPFKPLVNTNYKLIGIDSNGCIDSAFINIVVNANPTVNVLASQNPVCAKTPVKLTATGGNLYFWTDGIINGQLFVPLNGKTYRVTVLNEKGCSDTASIKLDVTPLPNVAITKNKTILTATQAEANYQWLNCNTNSIIANANGQNYTAKVNGNYAVIVSRLGCKDTSVCLNINSVGILENETLAFNVYPNPAANKLNITTNSNIKTVLIYNVTGQLVKEINYENNNLKKISLTIDNLAQGIYFLQIIDEVNAKQTSRFIKE